MFLKGLGILYRHGVWAAVRKVFRRKEPPKGIGLAYFLLHWVHRAGRIWPFPSVMAFPLNRAVKRAGAVDIVLTHGWGGGAETYLDQKIGEAPRNRAVFVVYPSESGGSVLEGALHFRGKIVRFIAGGLSVFDGLRGKKCRSVLNELARWPRIGAAVGEKTAAWLADNLIDLKHRLGGEMVYLLHDYYCVCPKLTLVAPDGFYCRAEVSMARCGECLKAPGPLELEKGGVNISAWRREFGRLLSECGRVIAFSEDTRRRVRACHPDLDIEVIPHEMPFLPAPVDSVKSGRPTIGVVGNLYREKGLCVVQQLARLLWETNRHDAAIKVVGTIPGTGEMPPNVEVLGKYKVNDLTDIVRRSGINVLFFPSVWPETFSYVTKELVALELPVACFDLGAQRDHVKAYAKGAIIPEMTAESAWQTLERLYEKEHGTCQ